MVLIGSAHFISHFFQLAVPVLFPLIKGELNVSYAEIGLLATLFYVSSGTCQSGSGFLVDHLGARRLLFAGIGLLCVSVLLCGLAPSYSALVLLMIFAGIGNSVFHPADFATLNANVPEGQLGRAYGIHTLGGNLGWATAPITVLSLAGFVGWRVALVIAGLIGLAALAGLASQSAALDDRRNEHRRALAKTRSLLRPILLSPAILLCFAFFLMVSITSIVLQNFLPAILSLLNNFSLSVGGSALTAFLFGSSAGTIVGAVMADRTGRHHGIVAGGLALCAAMIVTIDYIEVPILIIAVLTCAGVSLGITLPSRDMVVRRAAPRGASGRVFGFVYSGLDAGSAVAPLTVGILLDHGRTQLVPWLLALALALAILATMLVGRLKHQD
jgi:MFS family permease